VLFLFGMVLQYFRASHKFSEWAYLGVAALLALGAYALTTHYPQPWRLWLLEGLDGLWENAKVILSGTGLTSILANLSVKAGADKASLAVPVTNSK
jgi:hypothetical protein